MYSSMNKRFTPGNTESHELTRADMDSSGKRKGGESKQRDLSGTNRMLLGKGRWQ